MKQMQIRSFRLTDRNGKTVSIERPLFGSMMYLDSDGRMKIIRTNWWGYKQIIIPALEDRVEITFS